MDLQAFKDNKVMYGKSDILSIVLWGSHILQEI